MFPPPGGTPPLAIGASPQEIAVTEMSICPFAIGIAASPKRISFPPIGIAVFPIAIGARKCRSEPRPWRWEPPRSGLPSSRRAFPLADGNRSFADGHWRDGNVHRRVGHGD